MMANTANTFVLSVQEQREKKKKNAGAHRIFGRVWSKVVSGEEVHWTAAAMPLGP